MVVSRLPRGLPAAAATTVATAILGAPAGGLLARVALSSVTSFGGGEAYVAVAEGYFVASGDVSAADYYQQLVPIANALPGPILVKLAAAIGYASAAPEHGAVGGWLLGGSAGLVAIAACTLIAVLALAAYERVSGAPIVQDLGAVLLPVISGLLVTTSTEMLSAVGDVADQADASASAVMWVALLAVGAVAALRHRWRHDLPILVLCGAAGALALGV